MPSLVIAEPVACADSASGRWHCSELGHVAVRRCGWNSSSDPVGPSSDRYSRVVHRTDVVVLVGRSRAAAGGWPPDSNRGKSSKAD